jgi:uncharacterized protein (UPF0333 family)
MDQKKIIALLAVGVAVIAVGISYFVTQRNNGSGSVAISDSDPVMQNINWVKKKSKECGGDIDKLSPEDKAKVISILGQPYAAKSVKMYADAR